MHLNGGNTPYVLGSPRQTIVLYDLKQLLITTITRHVPIPSSSVKTTAKNPQDHRCVTLPSEHATLVAEKRHVRDTLIYARVCEAIDALMRVFKIFARK